jgi:hypothetical protein
MDRMSAVCSATPGMPATETCNGVDDDCNGMVDDLASLCMGNMEGTRCTTVGMSSFCGCATDADCGGANSGRVCDGMTRRCIDGCAVGMGRNGCPTSQFCTSNDPMTVGRCTTTCNFDSDCASAMPTRPICNRPDAGPGPANTCVECNTDMQCAGRMDGRNLCLSNTCAECGPGRTERCMASGNGSACTMAGLCGCASDTDCSADRRCNTMSNRCEPAMGGDGGVVVPDGSVVGPDGSVVGPDGSTVADGGMTGADGGRADGGSTMDGSASPDGGAITGSLSGDGACACRAPAAGTGSGSRSTALLGATAAMLALVARRRRQR